MKQPIPFQTVGQILTFPARVIARDASHAYRHAPTRLRSVAAVVKTVGPEVILATVGTTAAIGAAQRHDMRGLFEAAAVALLAPTLFTIASEIGVRFDPGNSARNSGPYPR